MAQLCDILKMDLLQEATVLTTTHDPNCTVNGVSIMEAPDIVHWVESNEIILTNLYSVHQDRAAMQLFVQRLDEKKLCALMIKIGRYFSEVPPEIFNAAQKNQIAIILIPQHVRFTELIYHIMAAVFDSQITQLNYFKQTRELFNSVVLKNAGINGIANSFTNIIHNPVIICDYEMEVLYITEPSNWIIDKQFLSEHTNLKDLPYHHFEILESEEVYPAYISPIQVLNAVAGYLIVVEKNSELDSLGIIAMQNAVATLSLEMLKNSAVRQVERNFRLDLFDDILLGRTPSSIEERTSSIGWRFDKSYTPSIIYFSQSLESDGNTYGNPLVDKLSKTIRNMIQTSLKKHGLQGIFENKKQKIILFVEQPSKDLLYCRQKLSNFFADFQEQIASNLPRLTPMHIGYISSFGNISQMPKLYTSAKFAMKIGTILNSSVCDFEKLGIYKLLCLIHNQEDLEQFIPQSLYQLISYDTDHQSNLVETLESYFNHNRNHAHAADSLFIHYKTMTYRINKIKEITGIDFKNQKEMLEIEIGLQIYRILSQS